MEQSNNERKAIIKGVNGNLLYSANFEDIAILTAFGALLARTAGYSIEEVVESAVLAGTKLNERLLERRRKAGDTASGELRNACQNTNDASILDKHPRGTEVDA